ncbi:MAG: lipase family protein [Burkholderiaceae bacterium]
MNRLRATRAPAARWVRLCATGTLAIALAACGQLPPRSASPVTEGPAGLGFYTPPQPLPAGRHGDLIWSRALQGDAALPSAARNWLVLYRSTNVAGEPIAVSGTVAIPAGTPPPGGWPVISWTHGTTGIADVWAPSRNGPNYPDKDYVDGINQVLDQWVKKGYAVLKTDYESLGTPGVHPYLNGWSEARGATDIVRAARQLSASLGRDWLVMGHSQGGQAAAYTAQLGPLYAPELQLKGAVAISPATSLSEAVAHSLKDTKGQANAFLPLIMVGMAADAPGVKLDALLTPKGRELIRVVDQDCIAALRAPGGWGTFKNDRLIDFKADFRPLLDALNSLSATQNLRPAVPLLVLQAHNDHITVKPLTDLMVHRFENLGVDVRYIAYTDVPDAPGSATHRATVPRSLKDAMAWVAQRFAAPR